MDPSLQEILDCHSLSLVSSTSNLSTLAGYVFESNENKEGGDLENGLSDLNDNQFQHQSLNNNSVLANKFSEELKNISTSLNNIEMEPANLVVSLS